ncbi:MAG: DUF4310 family protein [Alphaproteobacteria bacterium]|jgi:uncharacterized protein (TIGR03579 family)|nr:DUF4310 family protein [Alphaproteobacteria bacterium]
MQMQRQTLFLSNWFFPVLVGLACAGIVGATSMYINFGIGAMNEIFIVQLLDAGLQSGDYAAAAGFAAGFLIARVLEGPLVGLLDIGGSLMTGVGIGIPALLLASGYMFLLQDFWLALGLGLLIGLIIGVAIIVIRKIIPEDGMSASGTDIMMGAGNALGRFLGPLIILSAIQYGMLTGAGAIVGAGLFVYFKKSIIGGAILGAMIFGAIGIYI